MPVVTGVVNKPQCSDRATVVSVQDSPGLEVGDRPFDDIADSVDLGVELHSPSPAGCGVWAS